MRNDAKLFPFCPPWQPVGVVASLDREMIAMTPTYDVIRPDGGPAAGKDDWKTQGKTMGKPWENQHFSIGTSW